MAELKSPWLLAWSDPLAEITTVPSCMQFSDVMGDGDSKLLIADLKRQLKFFCGTNCYENTKLLGQPVALAVIYSEEVGLKIPLVAVAAGSHVFIFRNMRPYHRWKCPDVKIVDAEIDVWNGLENGSMSVIDAVNILGKTRETGHALTSRSTELLSYASSDSQHAFVNEMKSKKLVQQSIITCMGSIKRDSHDTDARSLLVVGTEASHVVILEQEIGSSGFLCEVALPTTPALLCITGLFDVEWRISVAGRDGRIYSMKQGEQRGSAMLTGTVIDPGGTQIVAMARLDKVLWVADMERRLTGFTVRGKRTKGITFKEDIRDLSIAQVNKGKTISTLLVGLADGRVNMYTTGLELIHTLQVERPVVALRFGSYGREDAALVIVHGQSSCITTMVMRRLADLDALRKSRADTGEAVDAPIAVPKKSKMFVEQCKREVSLGPAMHRAFQRDLASLRLTTARAYVKTLTDVNLSHSAGSTTHQVRMSVQIQGLGPAFTLKVALQNTGQSIVTNCRLLLAIDHAQYSMGYNQGDQNQPHAVAVPLLLPGPRQLVEVPLRCVTDGAAGEVLVLLTSADAGFLPIVSATVKMPVCEMAIN